MHYPANEMRLHLKSSCQEIIIVAINPDKLLNLHIPDREQSYTIKDTILYALGCGLGLDPSDEGQLAFAYEKDLQALPTMAVVLAYPGSNPRAFLGRRGPFGIIPNSQPSDRAACRLCGEGNGRNVVLTELLPVSWTPR